MNGIDPSCPPFVDPTKPATRVCWGCGGELPKYKQKWCGVDCSGHPNRWRENHDWGAARWAALASARWWAGDLPKSWKRLLGYRETSLRYLPLRKVDVRLRLVVIRPTSYLLGHYPNSIDVPVTEFETHEMLYECARCGSLTDKPEVNHIEPWGGGDRNVLSCKNHQSNLEVLDHECHRIETARQARDRGRERRLVNVGRDARVRGQAALL